MFKLFKKGKNNNKDRNHIILHNVYLLYLIFLIALIDFLQFVYSNDFYSASIFVLVGFLTSFFSKNMIVILFITIAITHILKYGKNAGTEGFGDDEEDDEDKKSVDENFEDGEEEDAAEVTDADADADVVDKVKQNSTDSDKKKTEPPLSVEKKTTSKKEHFGQDTKVVYTSDEDKSIKKNDSNEQKMLENERILKTMNRYKPLLDTLNGITKNVVALKNSGSEPATT
jgi:uncharacterized membrane protein